MNKTNSSQAEKMGFSFFRTCEFHEPKLVISKNLIWNPFQKHFGKIENYFDFEESESNVFKKNFQKKKSLFWAWATQKHSISQKIKSIKLEILKTVFRKNSVFSLLFFKSFKNWLLSSFILWNLWTARKDRFFFSFWKKENNSISYANLYNSFQQTNLRKGK